MVTWNITSTGSVLALLTQIGVHWERGVVRGLRGHSEVLGCFQLLSPETGTNLPTGKTVSGDTHCFAFRYSGSLFPAIARGCWLLVDIVKRFSTKWTVSLKGNSSMCGMCGAELFCTLHTNSWRHFWQVTMIDFCCTFCEGFDLYFARLGSAISVSDTLSSDKAGVLETSGGGLASKNR